MTLLVPRPPRSAVAGDYWIRVRPSVCPSVNFSGGFLFRDRTPKLVMHLGIGFVVQPKLGSYDLVKNEEFQHNLIYSLQAMKRPSNEIVGYVSL